MLSLSTTFASSVSVTTDRAEALKKLRVSAAAHPSSETSVMPTLDVECSRYAACFVTPPKPWCAKSSKWKGLQEQLKAVGVVAGAANMSRTEFTFRVCLRLRSCASYLADSVPAGCAPQRDAISRQIVHHLLKLGFMERAANAASPYAAAAPFPHGFFDGLFQEGLMRKIYAEVPEDVRGGADNVSATVAARGWGVFHQRGGGNLKMHNADERLMGAHVQGLLGAMKTPQFVAFLERLTGIGGLMVDDTNAGAGIHQIAPGGSLQIHADFNMASPTFHRCATVMAQASRPPAKLPLAPSASRARARQCPCSVCSRRCALHDSSLLSPHSLLTISSVHVRQASQRLPLSQPRLGPELGWRP